MGGQISSDLCDFAFHSYVESIILTEANKAKFGIKTWLRYRDDIFMVGSSTSGARALFALIRHLVSGIWIIECELFSRSSIPFLDVECIINGATIIFKPYSKPSKSSVPLNPSSTHPRHVHGWPIGCLSSIARRSSLQEFFLAALFQFSNTLIEHQLPGDVISRVLSHSSSWWHLRHNINLKTHQPLRNVVLVLPYHPVWEGAKFQKVLSHICSEFHESLHWLHRGSLNFTTCWKCVAPTAKVMYRN